MPSTCVVMTKTDGYFTGQLPDPVFTMSGGTLVATQAAWDATVRVACTVNQVGFCSFDSFVAKA